jgi:hypothetical protein
MHGRIRRLQGRMAAMAVHRPARRPLKRSRLFKHRRDGVWRGMMIGCGRLPKKGAIAFQ